MKRPGLYPSFIALIVSILYLTFVPGTAWAQDKCLPVTDEMKKNFSQYLQKKLKAPATVSFSVNAILPVENTCYRKLHFVSSDTQRPFQFDLFLSPDRRFLSRDLSDTSLDPVVEEKRQAEQLRSSLTKGKFASQGSMKAPVTIVVFSDFQCPFCKSAAGYLRQVAASESDNVRLVFRHLPLRIHPWARPAAEATACAQLQSDEAFWKLHDIIFENQRTLTFDNVQSKILEYAGSIPGLDMNKYQSCLANKITAAAVLEDMRFADANEIAATPTIFINGFRSQGIRSADQLRAAIRQHSAENKTTASSK